MNPQQVHPIEFFNAWFTVPIVSIDCSVIGIMTALSNHPVSQEEVSQDYIVPIEYTRSEPGRFKLFEENQAIFSCFVLAEDEVKVDPPVYFESCLDLVEDHGFQTSDIIDGHYALLSDRFSDFLWHMLGHVICVRDRSSGFFADKVNGIVIDNRDIELDDLFVLPMNKEFPAAYTCYINDRAICTPDWGAAFLNQDACEAFIDRYAPIVTHRWR